jgi:hypothetical protein
MENGTAKGEDARSCASVMYIVPPVTLPVVASRVNVPEIEIGKKHWGSQTAVAVTWKVLITSPETAAPESVT